MAENPAPHAAAETAPPDTTPTTETNCADGVDDDGDTVYDCGDHDCAEQAAGINATRAEARARVWNGRFMESASVELGVDISELNVVNMRNVPPTPANYAQRSGRAGRSGQPAFVFTYCSTGSNHDQYYFKRQEKMVAGAVTPPRLDIANEDLLRAHIHAIWLAESGLESWQILEGFVGYFRR